MATPKSVNILLVGDSGVGKTAYIQHVLTTEWDSEYTPTDSQVETSIKHITSHGEIDVNVIEAKGPYFPTDIDMVWIMFDVTNPASFEHITSHWYPLVKKLEKPVLLLGNKVDLPNRCVRAKDIKRLLTTTTRYYDLSAKSYFNFEKPFWEAMNHKYGIAE